MKRAMKRMLCLILSCVMLLGMFPVSLAAEEAAAEAEPAAKKEVVTIDFKDFALQAAEQPWWDDLHAGEGDGTKYLGIYNNDDSVTETEQAAYAAMVGWMKENLNW